MRTIKQTSHTTRTQTTFQNTGGRVTTGLRRQVGATCVELTSSELLCVAVVYFSAIQ